MVKRTAAQTLDAVALAEIETRRQMREGRVLRLARQQLRFAARHHSGQQVSGARWFCLQVVGNHDFTVEKLLTDCDVEVLVPKEKVTVVRGGKKFDADRSLFSGYLFVRCAPLAEAFDGLRKQKNVFGIVSGRNGYLTVDDKDLKRFQSLTKDEVARMPVNRTIEDGDKVRVIEGPFTGKAALVFSVKYSREPRARVSVDYDGNLIHDVDLPLAFLQKL